MASKFNFGERLRVTGHEYRKLNYGAALRCGCSCENRFVSKRWHPSFNPRLTGGGGGRLTPPSRIFAIAKKRTAVSMWNLAGLLNNNLTSSVIFFKIRLKFFEIWSILWRHYTPLLVENWPNFAGLWKTQFLMKTQMKNTKWRKMRSSTRWLSRFFKILGF